MTSMIQWERFICMTKGVCCVPNAKWENECLDEYYFNDHQRLCVCVCWCDMQKEFEKRVDPNDKNAQALLDEMKQHIKKVC